MKPPGASGCAELTFLGLMTVPAKTVCGHGLPSTRSRGVARVSPFGMDLHWALYCARFSQRVDLLCPCWGAIQPFGPCPDFSLSPSGRVQRGLGTWGVGSRAVGSPPALHRPGFSSLRSAVAVAPVSHMVNLSHLMDSHVFNNIFSIIFMGFLKGVAIRLT